MAGQDSRVPSGQVTENCHHISRFLTKPWEAELRRLRFTIFDMERFERGFSYSLFAEDKLNPQLGGRAAREQSFAHHPARLQRQLG